MQDPIGGEIVAELQRQAQEYHVACEVTVRVKELWPTMI
jgi:hypothetical protein